MEFGGEDKLDFPPQNGCFFGSGDTCWDLQCDSVDPECLCPASCAGSCVSVWIFPLGGLYSAARPLSPLLSLTGLSRL